MSDLIGENGDLLKALAAAGLTTDMSPEQAGLLLQELRPQVCRLVDGEVLCTSGDSTDRMWIITAGRIRVTEIAGGRDNVVTHREPYAVVGEVGLLVAAGKRSATMTASGRATVIEIRSACLEGISDLAIKAILWRNLAVIVASKLAQSVDARAVQSADADATEILLRRFVNRYALGETRTSLKTVYKVERAVIWFSDLVGFSEIAERVSPEVAAQVIKEAMTLQSNAIEASGGEVDKFIGDGLMAYWIIHGTRAEDVARAVNQAFAAAEAALAAITSMTPPVDGTSMSLRIGLNYGTPHSGNFGSENRAAFTVIGHDVNIAARLEQARHGGNDEPLGAIRVGEQFYQHLDDSFRCRLVGPIQFQVKKTSAALFTNNLMVERA